MHECNSSRLLMAFGFCSATLMLSAQSGLAQEEYVVRHSNGMILGPGLLSSTDSLSSNAFQQGSGDSKSIGSLDDGLRITYFNLAPNNISAERSTAARLEEIELPAAAEAARSGNPPAIQAILEVTAFNKYGRRRFSILTPRGRADVLQGASLITPTYTKLEVLNTEGEKFVWDTRIATSSIPPDQLDAILKQGLGMESSGDWLQLVRFYTQAKRYDKAREAMITSLQKYPAALAGQKAVVDQLDQYYANQKFEELKLRRNAGQHLLAAKYLTAFPVNFLPIESQIKLQTEIEELQAKIRLMADVAEALKSHVSQLPEPDQQAIAPLVDEILRELSHNTIDRMADFQRLRMDESIPNENKVALAISGWLLGVGSGMDNFAVVKSLMRVRNLVTEYLSDANQPRRQAILNELRGEEGAQPNLLDQMLETMKPPLALPEEDSEIPGLYRLSTRSVSGQQVEYVVQVPPEYDPNRKYPCLLALPGRGDVPELEINVWCGPYEKLAFSKARSGQATRQGYIVVSPKWMRDEQIEYQYTEGEHDRILSTLRDVYRKFSVDTDRVFITGHFDGATAAWDLAVSHPDLWAGAIMISPGADKYILQYDENVRGKSKDQIPLGTYVVYGQLDGKRATSKVGTIATNYMKSNMFDSLIVEYKGRGSGLFMDEFERIFEWMSLSSHRRVRAAKDITTKTMRNGDRFFYWLEAPQLLPEVAGNPYQFDPANAGNFDATLLDPKFNGVSISKIPSVKKQAVIWLTPDMVDFSLPVTVSTSRRRSYDVTPDIGVMLEDVRTRADRMHVFWQKIEL